MFLLRFNLKKYVFNCYFIFNLTIKLFINIVIYLFIYYVYSTPGEFPPSKDK